MRAPSRSQAGFTLIETLIAIVIFGIMTLGIVPVIAASLRASTLTKQQTVSKNIAVQMMERIRGLPFYISSTTQRQDVLDLYLPGTSAASGLLSNQTYTSPTVTTTCTSSTSSPACAGVSIPAGYTLTVAGTFMKPVNAAPTYVQVAPEDPVYSWRTATHDAPQTQLLRVGVSVAWTTLGRPHTYSLDTLVGQRQFGGVKISADAKIDYGVQALTSYVDSAGNQSDLTAIAGQDESQAGLRTVPTADEGLTGGLLSLVQQGAAGATNLANASGVSAKLHGPPDATPAGATVAAQTISHPGLVGSPQVAGLDTSTSSGLGVSTTGDVPGSSGTFSSATGTQDDLWVKTQANVLSDPVGRLDSSKPMLSLSGSAAQALNGATSTSSTPINNSATRKVQSTAMLNLYGLRLLPLNFVSSGSDRSLVILDTFSAVTDCKATVSASAYASATWSGSLRYYRDTTNDGVLNGSYSAAVPLAGSLASDPLVALQSQALSNPAQNPLVYDGLTAAQDIYLFQTPTQTGYISNWSSLYNVSSTGIRKDTTNREVRGSIAGAIRIDTRPTDTIGQSALSVSVGKLSCSSVDQR